MVGNSCGATDWNILNEELTDTDVAGLTNGRYTPIMVAVACGNNHIDEVDDCIGEKWMEGSENGRRGAHRFHSFKQHEAEPPLRKGLP